MKPSESDCEINEKKIRRKLKKVFLKEIKFSRLTLIILEIIIALILAALVLIFIYIITLNSKLKKEFSAFQIETNKKIEAVNSAQANSVYFQVAQPAAATAAGQEIVNNFGDSFSSLAFINESETDMKWDANVTSFSFPPIYSFEKVSGGASDNSGGANFSAASISSSPSSPAANLIVLNNELYYRDKKLTLPAELANENILNMTVNLVGTRWLVGLVTGRDYDETGWVYFFDSANKKFTPLITSTTALKIAPKFGRFGGKIAFGGTDNNFLIVYGGYDGHALYYYQGVLSDVSDFFGLRVAAGGFTPQIISRDNPLGTIFYICSETEGKPKLVKFWPSQAGKLEGAIDFSPLIFTNDLGNISAACTLEADAKILVTIKKADAFGATGASTETWRFTDNGFDNSADRSVTSFDIGQNRGKIIKGALISELGIDSKNITEANAQIFMASDQKNWQNVDLYNWLEFTEPTESLFWRVMFKAKPGSSDYSPWFDNINRLSYTTIQ